METQSWHNIYPDVKASLKTLPQTGMRGLDLQRQK